MSYETKLFGAIPYTVRDSDTPIYAPELIEQYLLEHYHDKKNVLSDVIEVFHDDKHNGNIIHVESKTISGTFVSPVFDGESEEDMQKYIDDENGVTLIFSIPSKYSKPKEKDHITIYQIIERVSNAIKKAYQEYGEKAISKDLKVNNYDEFMVKVTPYFEKFEDLFRESNDSIDDQDIFGYACNVVEHGYSIDFQNRIFKLELLNNVGAIYINDKLIASHSLKISPLKNVGGDFCWGYKNGGSTMRTAMVVLHECLVDYDQALPYYDDMARAFSNEFLSIFMQDEKAIFEEQKVLYWVREYQEKNPNIRGDKNIVKDVCKQLNISQKELADKMGIDDGTIRKWASGATKTPLWAENFMTLIIVNEKNVKAISTFKLFIEEIGVGKTNT